MLATTYTAQTYLLKGVPITVEVDLGRGLYAFSIVGLPDKAVEEARDRVSAALKNSGFKSPKEQNGKVTVSLSPASLKKEGSGFDVAIALAYLLATEQVSFNPEGKVFLGELSLGGEIRKITGVLPIVKSLRDAGIPEVYVPKENVAEATLVDGISVYSIHSFGELVAHLSNETTTTIQPSEKIVLEKGSSAFLDMADIRGQESAKRALEIAAAGGHNIALSGPPGTGKTLLARALAGILPPLSQEELLEVFSIYSIVGALPETLQEDRPFRSPHHTASYVSVIGGGANPRPGEVTLAHRGILFLDEFPEFDKRVIESLRQPLEEGYVSISRSKGSALFPANVTLVAAMNPCPCGFRGSREKQCRCTASDLARYERKLSGPIMDRIDIHIEVGPISYAELDNKEKSGESSIAIRERVLKARAKQSERFNGAKHLRLNSDMSARDVSEIIQFDEACTKLLHESSERLKLSARAYHRVQKLARTIADLAKSDEIKVSHILEALSYRPKTSLL